MTFGYTSARYLLSRSSPDASDINLVLGRSSSQSPLPDEAYVCVLDSVPYIYSSPVAVDIPAVPTSDPPLQDAVTTAQPALPEPMDDNNQHQEQALRPSDSDRPRSAPSSAMLALVNSESFDALAHRLQVPLSPELLPDNLSREASRVMLANAMESMLRQGHAVQGPRAYREAWVSVPSDSEHDPDGFDDPDAMPHVPAPAEATLTPPSLPLSIDPHLHLPRRRYSRRPPVGASNMADGDTDQADQATFGLNPFLSSNLEALDAFLSHLPPLSPSSAVTDTSDANMQTSFSTFRRRPLQPNDEPSHLRTVTGGFSILPDVPLSPMRPRLTANRTYALPSMGAYTHHVHSPTAADTGMPHPGDMTVGDLVRRDPYGAYLHWDDVQAVARAERERHVRHLGGYGWEEWAVGGAVATAVWEAKMIR